MYESILVNLLRDFNMNRSETMKFVVSKSRQMGKTDLAKALFKVDSLPTPTTMAYNKAFGIDLSNQQYDFKYKKLLSNKKRKMKVIGFKSKDVKPSDGIVFAPYIPLQVTEQPSYEFSWMEMLDNG